MPTLAVSESVRCAWAQQGRSFSPVAQKGSGGFTSDPQSHPAAGGPEGTESTFLPSRSSTFSYRGQPNTGCSRGCKTGENGKTGRKKSKWLI